MPSAIQPSFAAGELSPQMFGRVDLAKYRTGCATLRNMLVMPQGGARNRAGTRFIAEVHNSNFASRLIAFQFNESQSYVLEFNEQVMRVIRHGGLVESSPGSVYVLGTPYSTAQAWEANYTQSADVVTFVHKLFHPKDLRRLADNNWTIADIDFAPSIATPVNVAATALGMDGGLGGFAWSYKVTAISSDGTEESLPSGAATCVNNGALDTSKSRVNNISWDPVSGASSYNIYKDSGGLFGFIGSTEAGDTDFQDRNISPDTTRTVQEYRNPLSSAGNYPGVVEYHQQRRVFASTLTNPQTIWTTQSANIRNFDVSRPLRDSDAITATLSVRQVNEIRGLVSLGGLLVFTSGAEFVCDGDQQGVLTPASTNFRPQSYIGASKRPPLICGTDVVYEQSRGSGVRTIKYDYGSQSYASIDLSVLSGHMLRGRNIVDWAWCQEPHRTIFSVRNDGALLGLTYMREQEVSAWHRHDTQGLFKSVACVTEDGEDVAYFVVARQIGGVTKHYIERMESRDGAGWFLDCALSYEGAPATTISGLGHLNGLNVTVAQADGGIQFGTVSGGSLTLPVPITKAVIGLQYTSDLETLSLEAGEGTLQNKIKKVASVTVRTFGSRKLLAGPDSEHLQYLRTDQYGNDVTAGRWTGDFRVLMDSTMETPGRVFIRQQDPEPMHVLAVIPEISVGG